MKGMMIGGGEWVKVSVADNEPFQTLEGIGSGTGCIVSVCESDGSWFADVERFDHVQQGGLSDWDIETSPPGLAPPGYANVSKTPGTVSSSGLMLRCQL